MLEAAWWRGYRELGGKLGDMAPFYAWAGAMMVQDYPKRLGQPGVWLEERHLDAMRRWMAVWKGKAGIAP